MNSPLTVYKASAGSGKTFRLAVEYIKLLIDNPACYREILAVTFTNKATEEMKQRILSQLYGIAHQLHSSDNYRDIVCKELDISPQQAVSRAGKALTLLLHNYNYFRIETIDAFFQSILRNLARELELSPNLRTELNDTMIMEQAVDTLIAQLTPKSQELKWIMEYINDNISDDQNWNVIDAIKKFGKNIFHEEFRKRHQIIDAHLSDEKFFSQFQKQLRAIIQDTHDQMSAFPQRFDDILATTGISITDLKGGTRGPANYFKKIKEGTYETTKLINKTMSNTLEDPMQWLTKPNQKEGSPVYRVVTEQIQPLLLECESRRRQLIVAYKSAHLTRSHLYQLRLLHSIDRETRDSNLQAARFLLSDTQGLLHAMMKGCDTPFIFEKIGGQLKNIMIDEFQDTSKVQWQNFKVLLHDVMSKRDSHDLIVGDVKQSIYRWRYSDWRLLNNIEDAFPQGMLTIHTLQTNYRSQRNIIDFNNAFFAEAVVSEQNLLEQLCQEVESRKPQLAQSFRQNIQQLQHAYADVAQEVRNGLPADGYVNIQLLTTSKEDYQEETLQILKERIVGLVERGAALSDIAILVRDNKNIQLIADFFSTQLPDYHIVSDEAFRLDASDAVNILVLSMYLLYHPEDKLALAILTKKAGTIPPRYLDSMEDLKGMPIIELVEKLYTLFHLERRQQENAYICAFFDQVYNYISKHPADVDNFVKEWNDSICSKTIQTDDTDGIRILTIHKSKGLEFPYVFMPFCDWEIEKSNILWCVPQEAPYNALPIVPIDCSRKSMMESIYEGDYLQEHLQNVVDNLNLLYVAFTRAISHLYVIAQKNNSEGHRSAVINQCLPLTADSLQANYETDDDQPVTFEFGHDDLMIRKDRDNSDAASNPFTPEVEAVPVKLQTFDDVIEFRQSNKSKEFVQQDIEDEDTLRQHAYIQTGTILHYLFSNIRTADDIPSAIHQLESEGLLYDKDLTPERLQSMLQKRLLNKQVASWFAPHWQLFNECAILTVDPESGEVIERRPDRVMSDGEQTIVVDFKFGTPRPDYISQVQEYMQLLRTMGHTNVKGYLWFVYTNKIVEVKEEKQS